MSVGGTTGDTKFTTLKIDNRENIAVGGSSSDPTLVSATGTPNPIVLYVLAGGVPKWISAFDDTSYDEVTSIVVRNDNSNIIAAFDSYGVRPQAIVILSLIDGSMVKSYKTSSQQMLISPDGLYCFSSNDLIATF